MNASLLDFVESVLQGFRDCFKRKAAWGWFTLIVVGFMLRSDKLGVTSVIRDLGLAAGAYDCIMHFFRADSWDLKRVRERWYKTVKRNAPLYMAEGRYVFTGDGVKQSKEGRRMPGVKRLHQESEDSSKPEYVHGHMFGGLGILAGEPGSFVSIPLSIRLHDGLREAADWVGNGAISAASHVVQMIQNACEAVLSFGDALLLLDRYFLSVAALQTLNEFNAAHSTRLDIVTRAKMNCTAYEKPEPRKPGPGRPRKKGRTVHLKELFESHKNEFMDGVVELYGKRERVRFLCINLLWGPKLCQELRFVLVTMAGRQCIFVTTALDLDPVKVIQLYARRFSIECLFRTLKQAIGAFCYRFWTRHLPRLSHFEKKGAPSPLAEVKDEHGRKMILKAAAATEMHMIIGCVAIGILQILSLRLLGKVEPSEVRYLRTASGGRVSEATLMDWFRRNLFRLLLERPDSWLTRLIRKHQRHASPWRAA